MVGEAGGVAHATAVDALDEAAVSGWRAHFVWTAFDESGAIRLPGADMACERMVDEFPPLSGRSQAGAVWRSGCRVMEETARIDWRFDMLAATSSSHSSGLFVNARAVGIAGILAGVALAAEFLFFSLSGFSQSAFSDPASAMTFLRDHGALVRTAVLFGASGIVVTLVFLAGLADRLKAQTPTLAAATLLFGIVGNVEDGLVALSFWTGIPAYVALAGHDLASAQNSWTAFANLTSGYQGFGNLFLGLSALAAGLAIVTRRELPVALGAIGLLAGVAAIASVLGVNSPLGFFGFATAILLVIVFRVWAGIELLGVGAKRDEK